MTKIQTLSFILFLLLYSSISGQNGLIIEGTLHDAEETYLLLAHLPRIRGNLNFDDFKSIGAPIDENGKFRLTSEKIVPAAEYRLFFPENYILLKLFPGDSIYLDIYLTDPTKTFATGRGAGKINLLRLHQFQYDYFDLDRERSLEEFVSYTDSVIIHQTNLLEAVFKRQSESTVIANASNADRLRRIIEKTPISSEAFELVSDLVKFQRYSLLQSFMIRQSGKPHLDTVAIDLSSDSFRHFHQEVYQELDHINDWSLHNALENILQIEYLKNKQLQSGHNLTYGNWKSQLHGKDYLDWYAEFLKQNFKRELYTQYFAENITGGMTLGFKYGGLLKYLDLNENNKYVNRVQEYQELLELGLKNETYGLDHPSKNLDKNKFEALLSQYQESSLMIVFWSAWAAGASLVDEWPSLKAFEKNKQGKIDVIYICVDKKDNKKSWAARIIDGAWEGEHYFLAIEENETTLRGITDKNISSLCSGGATYTYINRQGRISKEIRAPFYLKQKDIEAIFR